MLVALLKDVSEIIKTIREAKRMTQDEVAERGGKPLTRSRAGGRE